MSFDSNTVAGAAPDLSLEATYRLPVPASLRTQSPIGCAKVGKERTGVKSGDVTGTGNGRSRRPAFAALAHPCAAGNGRLPLPSRETTAWTQEVEQRRSSCRGRMQSGRGPHLLTCAPMSNSPFLTAAIEAAQAGAEVIRRYYQRNLDVTIKADKSPVTQADVETEQAIRSILAQRFPSHGFYGEETGQNALDAEYLWLVDPIDGTKAFVREYPFFSTQIALMHRGRLIVGVSSAPIYGELAYAQLAHDTSGSRFETLAVLNNANIKVSSLDSIESCAISAGNLKTLAKSSQWSAYGNLIARASRIRGYGDFLHYHLLASGKIDVVIESDVNILDIAALAVIVEAAGGQFTDLTGAALNLQTTTVLASNGKLHDPVLRTLCP
jgi:histidinol-phosphatase